jgi:hypothetical protein
MKSGRGRKLRFETEGSMNDQRLILRGWKEICQAMRVLDKRTAKKRAKKYHVPIKYFNGVPEISVSLFLEHHNKMPPDF